MLSIIIVNPSQAHAETYSGTWHFEITTPGGTINGKVYAKWDSSTGTYSTEPTLKSITYGGTSSSYFSGISVSKDHSKAQYGTATSGGQASDRSIATWKITATQAGCTNMDRNGTNNTAEGKRCNAHHYVTHNTKTDGDGSDYSTVTAAKTVKIYFQTNKATTGTTLFFILNAAHNSGANLVSSATCTAAAVYINKCTRCGTALSGNYSSGSALGHNSAAKLVSSATCTAAAVYYNYCTRCGAKLSSNYSSGSALGHNYQTATTSVNNGLRSSATCTAAATYYQKCSRCSTKDTSKYNSVGSALGHSSNGITQTVEPTCLETGETYTNCSRCGVKMNQVVLDALGHDDNGIWVVDTDSTCLEEGTKHTNCSRCGEILNSATVIDPKGHS